ncbi:MAG: phosphatidylserine decarboxylase family protein [Prevotellaceae bacterium]|jgi:phosphatidylserine decarboxylase|nr:phosphatidylserine decarboxylase family protein [Prevotellaceae bacterium]
MTIHKEGRKFLCKLFLVLLVLNVPMYYFIPAHAKLISGCSLCIYLFFVNFFRRPVRISNIDDPNLLLAPCDGKVVVIEPTVESEVLGEKRIQISIFMSVFNVHANWYPIGGTLEYYTHQDGRFMSAHLPKSSTENERSTVIIETENKTRILVRQIAGALAQRIVTYAQVGKKYKLNDELGFIKFGSRMDVYLPPDAEILVNLKQKTVGNRTPIARLK